MKLGVGWKTTETPRAFRTLLALLQYFLLLLVPSDNTRPTMPSTTTLWLYKHVPGLCLIQTKLNQLSSYIPPPSPIDTTTRQKQKILLIQAHPVGSSFNHAIVDAFEQECLKQQHEVVRINLFQTNYNPIMSSVESRTNGLFIFGMPVLVRNSLTNHIYPMTSNITSHYYVGVTHSFLCIPRGGVAHRRV